MPRRADDDKELGEATMAAARSVVMTRDLSFGDGNGNAKPWGCRCSIGRHLLQCFPSAPDCRRIIVSAQRLV
jgi:hypothetical protein